MNIQYYGHSCFKVTTRPEGRGQGEITIFFDPFGKETGLRPPQGQTDIVLVSHDHIDHNNSSALKGEFPVFNIPGEYSAKGVNIVGVDSFHDTQEGKERGHNTIFLVESEGIKVCHLGDLGTDLDEKQLEEVDGVDVLMIPVGGGKYTIDGKKAVEIIKKIEPKIIIPMHYKVEGLNYEMDSEKKFCSEMGSCPKDKVSKINFKKKDIEEKNMEVILMTTDKA